MNVATNGQWLITPVIRDKDFNDMKELCIEFAISMYLELDYQQLLRESASIKDLYKMPKGAGFLLKSGSQNIGCIGLRKVNYNTAEIRKFYVRSTSEFLKRSNHLLEVAVDWAMQSNYQKIRFESSSIHPSLMKLFPESEFREKFIWDEAAAVHVKVMEKALVSIPEYYHL